MFSCEFRDISKNTFSYRTTPVAASVCGKQHSQHPKKDKKYLETWKQEGSCQKIQGSKEKKIKYDR